MISEERTPNERLRRARHHKGWTQSDLAEALETDFETVSRWERGITFPSAYYRERLCDVLEKTADELGLTASDNEPLPAATFPCLFLASSYADAEKEAVMQLRADLQARGITLWSSRQVRRQGADQRRTVLHEAIRTVQGVLLIVSPDARSSRHVQDALQLARIYRRCVCGVWIEGEHWQECLPKEIGELSAIIDARTGLDQSLLDELVSRLEPAGPGSSETTTIVSRTTEAEELPHEPRNPYKGLRAFRVEDSRDFFGRDQLVQELVEATHRLVASERPGVPNSRLLTIIGPSGSGKSSAVMAGLLPQLQAGGVPGSEKWVYLDPMVPGNHPIEALALTIAPRLPDRSLKTIGEDLEDDSARGLHLLATQLVTQPEARVVLLVDQFEELFTQVLSEDQRQHFIDLLLAALTEPGGPVIVLLTLRADFYDRPMNYPELGRLIEVHHTLVFPMEMKELRSAVEQPAKLPEVQLTFEGDLVGDLLFDVQGQVGALPLLQFTLDQLFQRRRGRDLTLQAYREIGGVKGALAKQAESTYASLPSEEHRRLARVLFLRLIEPGTTEQDTTRRRAPRSELLLSNPKETAILWEVVTAFTSARLLTTNTIAGVPTVEVSHEALIREWTRLAGWVEEAREDIRFQQAISEDAAEWEVRGKPADRLYRGSQLKDGKAWAKRSMPSKKEAVFLRASAAHQTGSRVKVAAISFLVMLLLLPAGLQMRGLFFPPSATTVTTLADEGLGSLRQAIDAVKPGGTITFGANLRGVIKLSSELNISKNLILRGPGASHLSITGSGDFAVIHVKQRVSATISGLAFSGTRQTDWGAGIIINDGMLLLTDSTISGNSTLGGAGAITNVGMLTITNSTIADNTTLGAYGGGIGNYSGSLTIRTSRISGNSAAAGAGIFNYGGPLTLSNSTVFDNSTSVADGYGGGIFNVNGGTLTLSNSTISGNRAGWGGGIDNGYSNGDPNLVQFNQGGPLTLINSTISGNSATSGGGILANASSQANITFCTIYGNTAVSAGGGIAVVATGSTQPSQVIMRDSLVAGNQAKTGPAISGTLTSEGYNLIQDVAGVTFAANKQHLTDVSVDPQADMRVDPTLSGRITPIHALFSGSPAIDRIPLDACLINSISTDQRGVKRPDGNESACDIGAYESSP